MKPAQPAWLVALQNDLSLITAQAAQRHWPGPTPRSGPYFNFRLEHVQQVEREVIHLLEEISADQETLLAMVWLHDRFKPQFDGDDHALMAATWARDNLAGLCFPADKIEAVAYGVEHHIDPPGTLPESAVEARLIWDANQLTKVGPLNVVGMLVSHPAFPEQRITYTNMALLGLEQLEKSRRLVNQFYFEPSRLLAKERYVQQKAFYEMFARDVEA